MSLSLRGGLVLALALPALALSACGGDDGNDDVKLDRAALSKQANAICKTYNARSRTLYEKADLKKTGTTGLATYLEQDAANIREMDRRLAELTPAGDVAADWEAFAALNHQGAEILVAAAAAFREDGTVDERYRRLIPKLNAAADKVGATGCGSRFPTS